MRTIGSLIKQTRLKKRISLAKVEEETKIKREFVKAIEKEKWESLPDYPVVVGFVKSLAGFLEIDQGRAVAFLRRDYPPKKREVGGPKPERQTEFRWSPKLTFLVGVLGLIMIVLGYLGFQYYKFQRPPVLSVEEPVEEQVVSEYDLKVKGKVSGGAAVNVNSQPVVVDENGGFETEIEISNQTDQVVVRAVSRSGKETVVVRKIKVEIVE